MLLFPFTETVLSIELLDSKLDAKIEFVDTSDKSSLTCLLSLICISPKGNSSKTSTMNECNKDHGKLENQALQFQKLSPGHAPQAWLLAARWIKTQSALPIRPASMGEVWSLDAVHFKPPHILETNKWCN